MSAFVAEKGSPSGLRDRGVTRAVDSDGPGGAGKLAAFFSIRSLRIRLVLIVLAIDAVAAALTGAVIVLKARTATQLEIASSMQLAETIVTDTIRLLADAPAPVLLKSIDLHFQPVRHVKIAVVDQNGNPVESRSSSDVKAAQDAASPDPPEWFVRWIGLPIELKEFPIRFRGEKIGTATIRSEPKDEIGEAWNYAYALFTTGFALNLVVLATLFILFGRVLAPLSRLGSGLEKIAENNYTVRLPRTSLRELAAITDHFNHAAEALASAQAANKLLNRQLLTAQDDERRRTALELHDEAGPCLFALEVNASSVATMSDKIADPRLRERAAEVVALIARVKSINRRLLDRLRPMMLGQIPLADLLARLTVDLDSGDAAPEIALDVRNLRASYGRLVDLTIYRCVQEGLCNAIRHGRPTRIEVTAAEDEVGGVPTVALRVRDNGSGVKYPLRAGLGLPGMRERVEALAGTFTLASVEATTTLAITLPIEPRDGAPADTQNSDGSRHA